VTFPTPYTVTVLHPNGTPSEDADGNTVETPFGTGNDLPAIAVAPHVNETNGNTTDLDTWDVDVFMPKAVVDTHDQMVVFGVTYEVVKVADWTHGFHGWQPGIVVGCKKWEG
jgi:hypothetical protein